MINRSYVVQFCALAACVVTGAAQAQVLGGPLLVQSSDPVIATFMGSTASYSNDLYLDSPGNPLGIIFNNHASFVGQQVNLGSFAAGTPLTFRIHVNDTGDNFFSGAASGNPDNQFHTRVTYDFGSPGTVLVEFEDLFNGPFEFNDLSFTFSNVAPTPSALGVLGLGGLIAARRRR